LLLASAMAACGLASVTVQWPWRGGGSMIFASAGGSDRGADQRQWIKSAASPHECWAAGLAALQARARWCLASSVVARPSPMASAAVRAL
jgi:hypothetical protein